MSTFTVGQIIKRVDGAKFPDDKYWAVVRVTPWTDTWDRVWIEGGQWINAAEITAVTPDEVLGVVERHATLTHRPELLDQFKPKPAEKPVEPLSLTEAQWRAVVNRHKKRAAKANEHNAQLMAACRSLEKEVAEAKVQARRNVFDGDSAEANHSALLLIREIVKEIQPVVRFA